MGIIEGLDIEEDGVLCTRDQRLDLGSGIERRHNDMGWNHLHVPERHMLGIDGKYLLKESESRDICTRIDVFSVLGKK
jgi:hypothetical protein